MHVPHLLPTAVVAATLALVATGCGLDTSEDVVGPEVDAARDAAVVPGVATGEATTGPAPTDVAGAPSAAGREPTSTTAAAPTAGQTQPSAAVPATGSVPTTAGASAADLTATSPGPAPTGTVAPPAGLTSPTAGTPTIGSPTAGSRTAAPPPGTRARTTAGTAPAAPTRLHTPSLVGLPASAAPLRLGASGFRSEYGRRYDVVRQSGRTAVLRAGHRADRPVTAQTPARPASVRPGDVVATATTRTPVPEGRRPRLITVLWGTLRLQDGVLEIGGLGRMADCDRLDHVQLGPRGAASRTVRVWVIAPPDEPRAGCTRRQPRVIRLRPGAGWDRDTVAVDVAADRR